MGVVYLPVSKFLRQGQAEVEKSVKADIRMGKEIVGNISLKVKNQGVFVDEQKEDEKENRESRAFMAKKVQKVDEAVKARLNRVLEFWETTESWAGVKLTRTVLPDAEYDKKLMERIPTERYVNLSLLAYLR